MKNIRANIRFISEIPKHFTQIGAVFPSSRALARELVRPIQAMSGSLRILEVGSGSGAVTRELLKRVKAKDHLFICEINPRLMSALRKSLEGESYRGKLEFFCCPVEDLRQFLPAHSVDFIISSLPFTNFVSHQVRDILDLYEYLLKPGGVLTFFEYVMLKSAGKVFKRETERIRIREVERVLHEWKEQRASLGKFSSRVTMLNLPPARTSEAKF